MLQIIANQSAILRRMRALNSSLDSLGHFIKWLKREEEHRTLSLCVRDL